jgi:hypothetical protein
MTVDLQAERVQELLLASQDIRVQYVFTEIAAGRILCESALLRRGKGKQRLLSLASKAHHEANRLMWKIPLGHPAFNEIMVQAERLRFELEALLVDSN